MKAKEREEILKLLRSGKFTIEYHDSGYCIISKGHHKDYGRVKEKDEIVECAGCNDGYAPVEVGLLVEALGGRLFSV